MIPTRIISSVSSPREGEADHRSAAISSFIVAITAKIVTGIAANVAREIQIRGRDKRVAFLLRGRVSSAGMIRACKQAASKHIYAGLKGQIIQGSNTRRRIVDREDGGGVGKG